MAGKRSYRDRCGIARALDVVGERWALLVVRELLLGPKRFTDLRAGLPNLSPDVLAQRLRDLEQSGVVRRRTLAPPAASRVYELTGRGQELEPAIVALGRWGSTAPFPADEARIGPDATAIALMSLFQPSLAGDLAARVQLQLGEDSFDIEVAGGELKLARGTSENPDATIEADPGTLAEVLWHGRRLPAAERSGDVAIRGNRPAAKRLLASFPLPEPAPA
jgi:DNA-binding HxlR family transcriptional regulator